MRNNDTKQYKNQIVKILKEIERTETWDSNSLTKILREYPKGENGLFAKDELVYIYNQLKNKNIYENEVVEQRIRMKPTRTNSGVAVVTVLTKPYPCPGKCIYCPNEENMPKSYIASEPGAQRAIANNFDPYAQVFNRLLALKNIGHNIEKVELIVLGGTWSYYVQDYQLSFIYECYRALNDMRKDTMSYVKPTKGDLKKNSWKELEKLQRKNELAYCRNVGLVFETRPDYINKKELLRMRKLGATKVQIGIQSLSDRILKKNEIGRNSKDVQRAFEQLRLVGFKIHGHWMPNLYGSTIKSDTKDFKKLWSKEYRPDELKIYPTSVIANTKLDELYQKGQYKPYTEKELRKFFKTILPLTPRYCRLTRIIRDIPSGEIVAGNKKPNLRQLIQDEMDNEGIFIQDIRSREIKNQKVNMEDLEFEKVEYDTTVSNEYFISYKTIEDDKICAFLRLSIPKKKYRKNHFIDELRNCSIIREVHVYGKVLGISDKSKGESQHVGLGKKLIQKAERISKERKVAKIAVISAIGTRQYYSKRGFKNEGLYMTKKI